MKGIDSWPTVILQSTIVKTTVSRKLIAVQNGEKSHHSTKATVIGPWGPYD